MKILNNTTRVERIINHHWCSLTAKIVWATWRSCYWSHSPSYHSTPLTFPSFLTVWSSSCWFSSGGVRLCLADPAIIKRLDALVNMVIAFYLADFVLNPFHPIQSWTVPPVEKGSTWMTWIRAKGEEAYTMCSTSETILRQSGIQRYTATICPKPHSSSWESGPVSALKSFLALCIIDSRYIMGDNITMLRTIEQSDPRSHKKVVNQT